MSINVNKVILVGRLGADPEARGREGGFVTMSVATSRSWRDKQSNEKVEKTEWHKVVIFNETCAKFAKEYLKKGDMVYVEGRLETRKYEKDGRDVYTTEVIVAPYEGVLQSISRNNGDQRTESRTEKTESRTEIPPMAAVGGGARSWSRDLDDEIPFEHQWK